MNILVSSSRGVGLHNLIKEDVGEWGGLSTKVISGGTFDLTTIAAKEIISSLGHTENPPHVYFMAGIPDITTLIKDKYFGQNHREVILENTEEQTISKVKDEIIKADKEIRDAGAKPIFCTITNMSISQHNTFLHTHKKTDILLHQDSYNTMQSHLDNILKEINDTIITHNRNTGVATPHCHSIIRKHRGRSGAGYYITDFSALYDGLHGSEKAQKLWAKAIKGAIKKNQDKFCEDAPPTPKRSWRGEKRRSHQI